jgi:tRNA G18 (ribose-2'-O)-methylase SpoU
VVRARAAPTYTVDVVGASREDPMSSTEHTSRVTWIDDPDDPRLEAYRDVRDRDLRGPEGRPGLFVVEAVLPVEQMLALPGIACSVLIGPGWVDRIAPQAPPGVPVYVAPPEVIRAITGFPFHRGALGVGLRRGLDDRPLDAVVPAGDGPLTILLCDGISNIDNIGLLFRNAAAFAVDIVVLSPACHDPLYRKSVRVSIGHVLRVPWARSVDWPGDLDRLRQRWGVSLIGAATGPAARPLDEIERPARVGLVVGQEYHGLATETVDRCDCLARIPMAAGVDSVNVAAAAAVCLHRFSRGTRM